MELDDDCQTPGDVNLTACLVLNQRVDEILGFDFVTFPSSNEVVGVVNLTPGCHFVYVKEGNSNDEFDRRLGEFVYIYKDTCTVLKRSKFDHGPLFEILSEEESRNYHNGIVAGHFHGKLSRIPEGLQQLWFNMTEYITEGVINKLRPIRSTKSDTATADVMINEDSQVKTISNAEDNIGGSSTASSKDGVFVNEDSRTSESYDSGEPLNNPVDNRRNEKPSALSGEAGIAAACRIAPSDSEDTVEDYVAIANRYKEIKSLRGMFCETFGAGSAGASESIHGSDSHVDSENIPSINTVVNPDNTTTSKNTTNRGRHEDLMHWEPPVDQCTIYYSDLQKINRKLHRHKRLPPSRISALHIDTSHIIDSVVLHHMGHDIIGSSKTNVDSLDESCQPSRYGLFLGEYQYAFCVFLLNYHYASFEHWKSMFRILCNAETFLIENVDVGEKVLNIIKHQLESFESDLYDPGNFFAYHLGALTEIIVDNPEALSSLLPSLQDIRTSFKLKFGISLDDARLLQVVTDNSSP
ncbi:AAR2 family protein [Babesia bovis T2Bo]|uniref:AAR2 protein n=1 Tax=Babesia bovis TaxID=5865 RepID=A7AQE1_BABBO|nr:AAR2 family protein [Babesia bovis T2Bo]EDO06760.1 AAR2 family protein [Babesia bovis T2Bo]|eukprot:XP_001610328.1 hypothetical protein [Babesia bovis T2Bo]